MPLYGPISGNLATWQHAARARLPLGPESTATRSSSTAFAAHHTEQSHVERSAVHPAEQDSCDPMRALREVPKASGQSQRRRAKLLV